MGFFRKNSDIEMERKKPKKQPEPDLEDDAEFTEYKPLNWKKIFLTPKYIPIHILLLAILGLTLFITLRHDDVVRALRPFSEKVRDIPAGWLIPIAILFVISFPPLFGHELIALLCGVVYGLWIGFAIVAAGTFIGEIGTWFAFKWTLRKRAEKLERTNLNYGALARLTRDGGFWIVLIIRFSVIPSHFSTAVFSTCDVNFWFFAVATFLTLPKQIILVYLGVLLGQDGTDGQNKDTIVKDTLFAATGVLTVGVAVWIWYKMAAIKKVLLQEQEERRARREMNSVKRARGDSNQTEQSSMLFNRQESPERLARPESRGIESVRLEPQVSRDGRLEYGVEGRAGQHTTPQEWV